MTDLSSVNVGLSGWGDVVMFHEGCHETFANKLQTKTLQELVDLANEHVCDPKLLSFMNRVRAVQGVEIVRESEPATASEDSVRVGA